MPHTSFLLSWKGKKRVIALETILASSRFSICFLDNSIWWDKATCRCRTELVRHCLSFLQSYQSFRFSSSPLPAPQPPVWSVKNLSTEPRAVCSWGWPTQSARFPNPPPISPAHRAAKCAGCYWDPAPHCTEKNPCAFGLDALVHQMCCVMMNCGNSDILHPHWVPESVEAEGKGSLASVCPLQLKRVMRFRKRLNTERRHFAVMLTRTDAAIPINLPVPGWKLIMCWSHYLASLSPVKDCAIVIRVHHLRWEGRASPSSEASGTSSGQRQDAGCSGHGCAPVRQELHTLHWVKSADAARCHL